MGELRGVYRYTADELATIRARLRRRQASWVDAVWDPILHDAHGFSLAEAGERGLTIRVSEYGIPWEQSVRISGWAGKPYGMAWLSIGPTPVTEDDDA